MGSRTLPTDCEHGNTVDWGDFGPCQNCDEDHPGSDECPNWTPCERCEQERRDAERAIADHVAASHAVANAARFLLALKDGPRDDYYRTLKPHAWEHLRSALTVLDATERDARNEPTVGNGRSGASVGDGT